MNWLQLAIAHAVKVALLAALVGAFVRGHARRCWSFVVYLGVIVSCNALTTTWPDTFFVREFWVLKQGVYDLLKLAIAIELVIRVVRAFPGTERTARASTLVALVIAIAFIMTGPTHRSYATAFDWQPQVAAAGIWLLALTALLVAWYRLPIDDWHRAIVLGFTPYLLLFVTLLNVFRHAGWGVSDTVSFIDTVAYLALCCWWAWAAWQPQREPVVTPEHLAGLAPLSRRA